MTPAAAQSILRRTIPAGLPVLLVGAPGIGKTALVQDLARDLNLPLVISHPVTGDPTDYRGLPWIVDGRAAFLPIGDLERLAALTASRGIWLIDDLGQAAAATQAALMQLVHPDGRALNGFQIPAGVAIIACTNRPEDRAGVGVFLSPLLTRFLTILTVEPEANDFVTWGLQSGNIDPLVAAFLLWMPEHLLDTHSPSHSLAPRCSPRTWHHVSRILQLDLPDPARIAAIQGAISPGVAIEFLAYLQVYQSLPDVGAIRADPDHAPIPAPLDARYATVVHLSLSATAADFHLLWRYVRRLPQELQMLFMLTATRKKPHLAQTPAYIQWATLPDVVAILDGSQGAQ